MLGRPEVAISDLPDGSVVYGNHIFLNMLPTVVVQPEYVHEDSTSSQRYTDRIRRLGVTTVEFRMDARSTTVAPKIPIRLIATNPTGYVLKVGTYVEVTDPVTGNTIFQTLTSEMADRYAAAAAAASAGDSKGQSSPGAATKSLSEFTVNVRYPVKKRRASVSETLMDLYSSVDSKGGALPKADIGGLHGKPSTVPYPLLTRIEKRRQTASALLIQFMCTTLLTFSSVLFLHSIARQPPPPGWALGSCRRACHPA